MIIPGLVSATLKDKVPKEVISLVKTAKLEAIEWSEGHHVPLDNEDEVLKIKRITEDENIKVASYGSYYRLGEKMDFSKHLKNAMLLKAPKIRIWAGTKPSTDVSEEEYKCLLTESKEITEIAKKENIKISLEWHKNTLTDTNESGLRLLSDVKSPFFTTFWQPTQALSVEERKKGIRMISPFLENFHVYYWKEEGRRPLKEGIEIWKSYFSELDYENNDYYALLEFVMGNSTEQYLEDAKALKQIIGR